MHVVCFGRQTARLGLAAAVALLGCGDATGPASADVEGTYILERVDGRVGQAYTFRRVRGRGPTAAGGSLEIAVVDAAGRQVGGATLRIRAPDGLITRAGSTEYHTFLTGGPAGEWTITVTPPSSRALAPDQPNPVRVAVPARQTVVVRIPLIPTGGGV